MHGKCRRGQWRLHLYDLKRPSIELFVASHDDDERKLYLADVKPLIPNLSEGVSVNYIP